MATQLQPQPCPRCGTLADNFIPVDPGMRLVLQDSGVAGTIQDTVCQHCFDTLTGSVSQGLKMRMEKSLREKNKMIAWKNRIHLLKNARNLMSQKAYSEAAVQYEKYIRVLEVVYNLKRGELVPSVFSSSARSRELTVIASVYWDLLRIYDTSPYYGDRMQGAATKLSEFLQFSHIYPDIVKKADLFSKSCKNPAVVRQFLKTTRASRGPCFIATAAFAADPGAVELIILRRFRDRVLRPSRLGRRLIWLYYRTSPPIAAWVRRGRLRSRLVRWIISMVARSFRISSQL